ncbi:fucose isomerase [Clostridium thermosuccinogenes]|uniref:Fucose isomerase n=1 Tax=Clostridium thermosuccinogenes TaxID=84032 RepID=A0A2K2FL14_9CLOT|nr:L-fucose/L-arabinose isomerase family protein [Pseudoclostridium thermosuccinogenes]AUS96057.1 fucose isomerase [Pseudoclostridium thermosuccinogenes]PNT99445.1 fucose isomerase [Pseudoclostridium thermosuccinogenes]PNU01132.1 fucose isomerase [Pseudoclostridium thermosuccinogenes]
MKNRIKLGYAPTRRFIFSKEDAYKYKELTLKKIKSFTDAEIVDIEGINKEGLLFDDNDDIKRVIKKFKDEEVDAVFFPHCNFGTEDSVARVAKAVGKPVLIWGPRDEAPLPDGNRLRDTQCGLFATGKVLRRHNVPFTYIVNSTLEDPVFERGYINFISAASVVKAMSNLRILQISTRPASFLTMMYDEGMLLEKFGISVIPTTLQDIKATLEKIETENGSEFRETIELINSKLDCSEATASAISKVAALKVAIKKLVTENGCTAAAIQCWTALQDSIGIVPCLCNALLTDEGIPVTCETDIHGAITAVMAQAAAMGKAAPFFADLTVRHPENDNGELLFHCGNFPVSLVANGCTPKFGTQFALDSHAPGTVENEIRGGDISVVRFDGDHGEYSLFLGKAKGIKGPFTRGTYLWVEVNDWPLWEEKLVKGPYVHHCTGIHHDVIPALYEACNYIPGLKADPVDPTEEQIKAWLRGGD